MAERLQEHDKREKGIHAATTAGCGQLTPLSQQLYEKARIYLDIYRGVD